MPEITNSLADVATKYKTRRAIIREEYVALTGDYVKALILNQFIYWFDKKINFDIELRNSLNDNIADVKTYGLLVTNGWVWKSGQELAEETMLIHTPKANGKVRDNKKDSAARKMMREHIMVLVENGWLEERNNPRNVMDKTKQYRPNLVKIKKDLSELGYKLDVPTSELENVSALVRGISKSLVNVDSFDVTLSNTVLPEVTPDELKVTPQLPEVTAIPQNTTENTTTTTSEVGGVLSLTLEEIERKLSLIGYTSAEIQKLTQDYPLNTLADVASLTTMRQSEIKLPKRYAQTLLSKGYDATPLLRLKNEQDAHVLGQKIETTPEVDLEDEETKIIISGWIETNPEKYEEILRQVFEELPPFMKNSLNKKIIGTGQDPLETFINDPVYYAESQAYEKIKKHLGL